MIEPLLDGAQVNWFFDDLEVVWNSKSIGIYRFVKDSCSITPPELVDQTLGSLVPAIVERNV